MAYSLPHLHCSPSLFESLSGRLEKLVILRMNRKFMEHVLKGKLSPFGTPVVFARAGRPLALELHCNAVTMAGAQRANARTDA